MTAVRLAGPDDVPGVVLLLEDYMQEAYDASWTGTEARLRMDAFGVHCRLAVAEAQGLVGFIAWRPTYDLHHCLPGIEVIDMYVRRSCRGQGIAVRMLAAVAAQAGTEGSTFMTGGAVERGSARKLYDRIGVTHGCQHYLSGRAFRALAAAAGASARDLVSKLPPKEWNFEA